MNAFSTTKELEAHRPRMAILPVGATEQHSAHLPLATDTLIIEAISQRVAAKLGAYCLPALPFSISHMHRGSKGTVWLRNETLTAVIRDVAQSVRHDGFKQFVILNGHGGNFVLLPIVQDLNLDFPDLLTLTLKPTDFIASTGATWRHADEVETSLMLYLQAELVRRDKLRDQTTEPDRELLRYLPFKDFARLTHTGKPTRATVEHGRRAIEHVVACTVQNIQATLRKVARATR